MNSDRYSRARKIFHAVYDMSRADRETALDEMCKDDPEMRSHVVALLNYDSDNDDTDNDDVFAEANLEAWPPGRSEVSSC